MTLNALEVLGWDPKDDPQSAVVQEQRLSKVRELTAEVETLRARVAELEAQVAKPARGRAKAADAADAESAE